MQVIIIFHVRGFNKQELAGCYEVVEVVAGYRGSSGSFCFLLAGAEGRMGEKVRKRKNCEICLFFLPRLPVVARQISIIYEISSCSK